MGTRRTLAEVATLTDADAIADEYRIEDEMLYRPSQSTRTVYFADVHTEVSDTLDDSDATMVGKAEEFVSALREWCKVNGVKARLAETVVALSQCTRTTGYKYPYSMSELGAMLGCTHQTARERYVAYLKYESDVKRIAESVGLVA